MIGEPKGLLQRRAALIAWVAVLTVAGVLNAVWLLSDDRASLNYPVVVSLGLAGALAFGVVVAYLWDRRVGRLKHPTDVAAATGLPVLGVVPALQRGDDDRVAVSAGHPVAGTQAYAIVAAGLGDTVRRSGLNCLLVTSPTRGAGRTTTAVNLSTLLAAEGLRVGLVSADPEGEGVDELLGLERQPGLAEVLDGSSSLDAALQQGGVDRLQVLTAGGTSVEMLGHRLDKLALVLDRLTRGVDLVVIDAPPVLGGLETMLLAQDVDLVLFVVDRRHGRRSEATTALAYLGHVQDRLVGVVSNDPGPRRSLRSRRTRSAPAVKPGAAPRRPLRQHRWAAMIATAVAVALVISTVWWLSYDDRPQTHDEPATPDAPLAVAMDECQSTWNAQESPLDSAATSMRQWQVHIMATNQLVAGKITLYQATAYWQRTRAHAARTVHRFHQADDAYQAGQHSCRPPDIADDPDASLAAFTACQHNIAQRDDTLRAARAAIDTWHHHLMNMRLMGTDTGSHAPAAQRWSTYWKQGVAELHHYRSQRRQTKNQRWDCR